MNYLVSPDISEEVDDSLADNIIGNAIDVRRYKNSLSVFSVGSVVVLTTPRLSPEPKFQVSAWKQYKLF